MLRPIMISPTKSNPNLRPSGGLVKMIQVVLLTLLITLPLHAYNSENQDSRPNDLHRRPITWQDSPEANETREILFGYDPARQSNDARSSRQTAQANEETGDSLVATELASQRDEERAKIYERIVLEGSEISISCPHLLTITRQTLEALNHEAPPRGLLFNHKREEQKQAKNWLSPEDQRANSNSEPVKWFRNHVPLPNVNHFQSNTQAQEQNSIENLRRQRRQMNSTESNRAAGLSATSPVRHSKQARPMEGFEKRDALRTRSGHASEAQTGDFQLTDKRNVNEQAGGDRRLANMPEIAFQQWRVNKFGELVMGRVSRYWSGKYTCLSGGKQSEVILDVLLDKRANVKNEQASKFGNFKLGEIIGDTYRPLSSLSNLLTSHRDSPERGLPKEVVSNGEKVGNGSIEIGTRLGTSTQLPYLNRIDLTSQRGGKERSGSLATGSNSSRSRGGYAHLNNDTINGKAPIDGEAEKLDDSLAAQMMHLKNIDSQLSSGANQHPPIHLVASQIIQQSDLRSIPGFLYTRQQLKCPVSGNIDTNMNVVKILAHTLCSGAGERGSRGNSEGEVRRCYQLAMRYIFIVENETRINVGSNNCSQSIVEVVWMKDGKQLEFDRNGRETSSSLNIKLIDFLVQFEAKTSTSDDSVGFQRRSNIERSPYRADAISSSITRTCPPRGQTLEFEGLGRESAGRYTCALKLSSFKLEEIIRGLERETLFGDALGQAIKQAPVDNDTSCCDEPISPQELILSGPDSEASTWSSFAQIGPNQVTINSSQSIAPTTNLRKHPGDEQSGASNSLAKRIALLESILRRASPADDDVSLKIGGIRLPLDYMEQQLSRLRNPLATIQTFLLVVNERAANSCDLWSTIREAEIAYNRRKLADFKRLKRNLRDNHQPMVNGNLGASYQRQQFTANDGQTSSGAFESLKSSLNGHHSHDYSQSQKDGGDQTAATTTTTIGASAADWQSTASLYANMGINLVDSSTLANSQQLQTVEVDRRTMLIDCDSFGSHNELGGQTKPSGKGPNRPGCDSLAHEQSDARARARPESETESESESDSEMEVGGHEKVVPTMRGQLGLAQLGPFNYANEAPGWDAHQSSVNYGTKSAARHNHHHRHRLPEKMGWHRSAMKAIDRHTAMRADLQPISKVKHSRGHEYIGEPSNKYNGGNNYQGRNFAPDRGEIALIEHSNNAHFHVNSDDRNDEGSLNRNSSLGGGEIAPNDIETALRATARDDEANNSLSKRSVDSNELPTMNKQSKVGSSEESLIDWQEVGTDSLNISQPIKSTEAAAAAAEKNPITDKVNEDKIEMDERQQNLAWNPLNSLARDDESLNWAAGQYLYMHMRAVAASTMFGVQVDVEWSNERTNGSSIEPTNWRLGGGLETEQSSELRDVAPFATIEMIAGQNLHLQCTAQALGRLPEVKWYKRISAMSSKLGDDLVDKLRMIGQDLYWPLTELNLLDEDNSVHPPFVCSQTISVFDNLINQTFTVVNSLHLSQYNDVTQFEPIKSSSQTAFGSNYNLYACIVDADVRHNYATLGVKLRLASRKIPLAMSKRLQARSKILAKSLPIAELTTRRSIRASNYLAVESKAQDPVAYNLIRQGKAETILLKNPLWIPIQNMSATDRNESLLDYSLTPSKLLIMIIFVFSALLALVYLTLKSYQNFKFLQTSAEDLDDQLEAGQSSANLKSLPLMSGEILGQEVAKHADTIYPRCLCQFTVAKSLSTLLIPVDQQFDYNCDGYISMDEMEHTKCNVFGANLHNLEPQYPHYSQYESPEESPLMVDLPFTANKNTCSFLEFNQSALVAGCCQDTRPGSMISLAQSDASSKINVIENPLNREYQ